jgi:hypothetical protein
MVASTAPNGVGAVPISSAVLREPVAVVSPAVCDGLAATVVSAGVLDEPTSGTVREGLASIASCPGLGGAAAAADPWKSSSSLQPCGTHVRARKFGGVWLSPRERRERRGLMIPRSGRKETRTDLHPLRRAVPLAKCPRDRGHSHARRWTFEAVPTRRDEQCPEKANFVRPLDGQGRSTNGIKRAAGRWFSWTA